MKASYGKINTPTMSTFESRLEFLNHPPEWHEEHRRQMKRQQQLEEFHQWATSWSQGVIAARKRTQEGIEFVYNALMDMEDAADQLDTQECAQC